MTPELLHSDIELAIRLRGEQCPDEEIIQALVHRRVDRAKAAQLLDDLRNGRDIEAQAAVPSEFGPRRHKRQEHRDPAAAAPPPPHRTSHPPRRPPRGPKISKLVWWIVLAPLGLLVVVLSGILIERRLAAARANTETPPAPSKGGLAAPRKQVGGLAIAAPALELQPEGLRIGGRLVARDNPLAVTMEVLGEPSRTNRVEASGATVYAFDHVGVLVYVQPTGRTNSVMLDCDATGGANGTALPFAGTLKIGEEIIGPDADARMLAALKPLGLSSTRSDGSIWGGRYGNLRLVFAYLKSPQRLSLIGIDLE